MIVGVVAAKLIDFRHQEFRRFKFGHTVKVDHLVKGAVHRPFG